MKQPAYELRDETGEAIRRFYSMEFAEKFLCPGYTITKLNLPKPPHPFQQLLSLNLGDPPF
jgi:hypothetical protein